MQFTHCSFSVYTALQNMIPVFKFLLNEFYVDQLSKKEMFLVLKRFMDITTLQINNSNKAIINIHALLKIFFK